VSVLVYGAAGYSGRLIVERALQLGLQPILAGRDAGKLRPLAESLGLPFRTASVHDSEALHAMLRDVGVLLNVAGPFSGSARALASACLRARVHYLDITGEPLVIEGLAERHREARRRGVMLLPGVGFDVVASDCLAAHVARRAGRARHLAIGIRGLGLMSRGSARSFVEQAGVPVLLRRDGRLVAVPPGARERAFDYGSGPVRCVNVSWGDVVSAWHSTGIPNVDVYFDAPPAFSAALAWSRAAGSLAQSALSQVWLKVHADMLPEGPTAAERATVRVVIVAEAADDNGCRTIARLETPQSYSFTSVAAAAVLRRVALGDTAPGFQTPSRLLGADFVLSLPDVARHDVA
jgi:short subunit dehydrogenase-like uncharacterized protein